MEDGHLSGLEVANDLNTRLAMTRRRWVMLMVVIGLVWGFGLRNLQLNSDVLALLPEGLPSARAIAEYEGHFENADELIIGLDGLAPDLLEAAARELAEVLRGRPELFKAALWTPPWMEHPAELAELAAYLWINGRPGALAGLAGRLEAAALAERLEFVRDQLTASFSPANMAKLGNDPLGLLEFGEGVGGGSSGLPNGGEMFANREGTFRLVLAKPSARIDGHRAAQVWHAAARGVVESWRAGRAVEDRPGVHLTGRPAFVAEISQQMRRDLTLSTLGTSVVVGALFWLAHRQLRTLVWLLALLGVAAVTTLALGGLIYRELNLISVGFGGILLGLVVDYALILHQEAREHGGRADLAAARVGPGIVAAALTTAGAFGLLNFSGLPGLGQLGSLVAVGVLVGAWVMLRLFPLGPKVADSLVAAPATVEQKGAGGLFSWAATAGLLLAGLGVVWLRPTSLDTSAEPLRPAHSQAHEAMAAVQRGMGEPPNGLWLVASAPSFEEVGKLLDAVSDRVEAAKGEGMVASATLATPIWPRPSLQVSNLAQLPGVIEGLARAETQAREAGFSTNALGLSRAIRATWADWLVDSTSPAKSPRLPGNATGAWLLGRFMAADETGARALGIIRPAQDGGTAGEWLREIRETGVAVGGWEILGREVFGEVRDRLVPLMGGLALLVVCCLLWALRSARATLGCAGSTALAFLSLNASMGILGWSWNLMSLLALPVLLGSGLDFSLHLSLGLKRHGGDVRRTLGTVGKAVALCAATTAAGFGSLAWTSSVGLASLGKVCALGVFWNAAVAIGLLPVWSRGIWQSSTKREK
jgi:predicted exporter